MKSRKKMDIVTAKEIVDMDMRQRQLITEFEAFTFSEIVALAEGFIQGMGLERSTE